MDLIAEAVSVVCHLSGCLAMPCRQLWGGAGGPFSQLGCHMLLQSQPALKFSNDQLVALCQTRQLTSKALHAVVGTARPRARTNVQFDSDDSLVVGAGQLRSTSWSRKQNGKQGTFDVERSPDLEPEGAAGIAMESDNEYKDQQVSLPVNHAGGSYMLAACVRLVQQWRYRPPGERDQPMTTRRPAATGQVMAQLQLSCEGTLASVLHGCTSAGAARLWVTQCSTYLNISTHQLAVTAEAFADGWLRKRQRSPPQGPPALPVTEEMLLPAYTYSATGSCPCAPVLLSSHPAREAPRWHLEEHWCQCKSGVSPPLSRWQPALLCQCQLWQVQVQLGWHQHDPHRQ